MTKFRANIHKEIDKTSREKKGLGPFLNYKEGKQEMNIDRFPPHLSPPPGARTVNMIALATIPAGTVVPGILWEYRHTDRNTLRFTHYAIFNDALLTASAYFIPLLNGNRIFPFHGNPYDKFKLSLGNCPDMSNAALDPVMIDLKYNQLLQWMVVNTGAVDADMGARMVGYIDSSLKHKSTPFGG